MKAHLPQGRFLEIDGPLSLKMLHGLFHLLMMALKRTSSTKVRVFLKLEGNGLAVRSGDACLED